MRVPFYHAESKISPNTPAAVEIRDDTEHSASGQTRAFFLKGWVGSFLSVNKKDKKNKQAFRYACHFVVFRLVHIQEKQAFDPQLVAGNIEAAAASRTLSCVRKVGQSSWHERINI